MSLNADVCIYTLENFITFAMLSKILIIEELLIKYKVLITAF